MPAPTDDMPTPPRQDSEEKWDRAAAIANGLVQKFANEGKLIEAGWIATAIVMKIAPENYYMMKLAYMAGAQHLYSSIMNVLDPGDDPTPADLRRMELIDTELTVWTEKLKSLYPIKGSG